MQSGIPLFLTGDKVEVLLAKTRFVVPHLAPLLVRMKCGVKDSCSLCRVTPFLPYLPFFPHPGNASSIA